MADHPNPARTSSAPLMVTVSGMRGIVGRSLTPEVVVRYVACAAAFFRRWSQERGSNLGPGGRPVVVVGSDGRQGGEAIARLVSGALMSAGCDVVDCGVAMTPTVGVVVQRLDAAGGLVVTASHNPGEWNGLKPITALGGAPAPAEVQTIIDAFGGGGAGDASPGWATSEGVGRLRTDRSSHEFHVQRVLQEVGQLIDLETIRNNKFKVVVDSVNASGTLGARWLLEELGCQVVHLNNDDSGVFPHTPEPTRENLVDLCDAVRKADASVGFAQDPDADRLALIDTDGTYIGEEYTLALCAMSYLASLPPERAARELLAANLSTSRMIDDVAAMFEATVVRTPVGEANVVAGMRENGCTLGGEGNGGVVWMPIVPIRDSLGSMALTLALMARTGQPIGASVARIPRYAIEKRKIDAAGVEGLQADGVDAPVAESLREAFAGAGDVQVTTQDGVRLDFDAPSGGGRAWVHVRPSNTEPVVRLIAEAPSAADAGAILDRTESIVTRGVGA